MCFFFLYVFFWFTPPICPSDLNSKLTSAGEPSQTSLDKLTLPLPALDFHPSQRHCSGLQCHIYLLG